jgi:hypothetical protein
MLRFVLAHMTWNPISTLELQRSYNALLTGLVLLSASTMSNICRREYTLTVDAIKKELSSRSKVSLALDGGTLTNKLAITSEIAYYLDQNWALRKVQLAFNEIDIPFMSFFEGSLRMTDQGSAYRSTANQILEGSSRSF